MLYSWKQQQSALSEGFWHAPEQRERNPGTAGAPRRPGILRTSRNWVMLSLYLIIYFQPLIQNTKPAEATWQPPSPARQKSSPESFAYRLSLPQLAGGSPVTQRTSNQQPGWQPLARYHLQAVPSQTSRSLQKQPVSLLTLNCWAFSPLNPAGTGTAGGANWARVVRFRPAGSQSGRSPCRNYCWLIARLASWEGSGSCFLRAVFPFIPHHPLSSLAIAS